MAKRHNFPGKLSTVTATIAASATTSGACDCGNMNIVGIITPAALTGTALTLKASVDGTNFFDVYDSGGTQVSVTVSTSRYISLVPSDLASMDYVKVVSGSAEAAEREIILIVRALS